MMPVIFLDGRVQPHPCARKQAFVTIYLLRHPLNKQVRYVGKSQYLPGRRLTAHIQDAKAGGTRPVANWIRGIVRHQLRPIIETIETVPSDRDWAERERYWIAEYRRLGARLLNLTSGGEGLAGHAFAGTKHAQKISASLRRGAQFICETCGTEFWRKPSAIRRGHNRFCSRLCSNRRARNDD